MYDWCVAAAGKPHATWTLGTVSFVESSFFPIPPDAMLLPMSLARPDRAYYFALVCTLTSVAGGILGYAIGYFLYESLGLWLMQLYGYGAKIEWFQQQYREWGAWFILIKGLTPIPYKLVTIVSGFAEYPILPFILCHSSRAACASSSWRSCATATAIARARSSRSVWSCGPRSSRSCWWSELSQRSTCFEGPIRVPQVA